MSLPYSAELNRRILIRKQTDQPVMGGTVNQTFDAGKQVWAKHHPVGNAIFFGTKQVGEDVTDRFIIRRSSDFTEQNITSSHVIDFDGQRYRVKRCSDLEGKRLFLIIETEGLGNA